jgi:hypothetical protein
MRVQIVNMMNATPMADLLDLARQNMSLWSELQKRMFGLAKEPEKGGEESEK